MIAVLLAGAIGTAGLCAGAVLIRAALALHRAERAFVSCRGAGLVGMGALCTGLTGLVPWWAPEHPSAWITAGLTVAAVCFVAGTSLLPGAASNWVVRLRRAYDGVGLGVSLGFAIYLVPAASSRPGAVPALLIAAAGIAIVTVIVLRARPRPRAAAWCGAGTSLVMLSLGVLGFGVTGPAQLLAGLGVVAGLGASAWGGSRRDLPPPPLEPRNPDQYLASYPLLAVAA
jgi:hypothetical protein